MQYRFFTIPIWDSKASEDEMNAFLRSHRIADVEKRFIESSSTWSFCITYIENGNTSASIQPSKDRTDYKEVLDEQAFAKYLRLRDARKQIANEEAIPAYSVFTNEMLAEIAALDELTETRIGSIKGIGEKKAEKYGKKLLELYQKMIKE